MADLYRKKPVTVEVMGPLSADNLHAVAEWCGARVAPTNPFDGVDGLVLIPTLEGLMTASIGDYIIKGVQGEFYPCKPDIFAATYEPVEARRG